MSTAHPERLTHCCTDGESVGFVLGEATGVHLGSVPVTEATGIATVTGAQAMYVNPTRLGIVMIVIITIATFSKSCVTVGV